METEIAKVLEAHIVNHLEETRHHTKIVERILEDLDEDPSAVKEGIGNIMGMVTGATTAVAEDRLVKNAIAEHGTEHFEMASYEALIAAAERLGRPEDVDKFDQILQDEVAMAKWLKDNLPNVVQQVMVEKAVEE